jgi:non-lysosomal glucosylceramidase
MIYEGLVEEGLEVVGAIRARFDGQRRNPWNEQECGHHYARAMASWAVLLALGGFRYSAVSKKVELVPRWRPEAFHSFWAVSSGWGMVEQSIEANQQVVHWEVLSGELLVEKMRLGLPPGRGLRAVTLETPDQGLVARIERMDSLIEITLAKPVTVTAEKLLAVRIELA